MTLGVPRRSILEPSLFNFVLNDLVDLCPDVSIVIMYADDVSLFLAGADVSNRSRRGNVFLEELRDRLLSSQ